MRREVINHPSHSLRKEKLRLEKKLKFPLQHTIKLEKNTIKYATGPQNEFGSHGIFFIISSRTRVNLSTSTLSMHREINGIKRDDADSYIILSPT